MAPSLDCAVSSLLCAEETDSIYYDDDDDGVEFGVVKDFEATWHHRKNNKNLSFNGEEDSMSGLPSQSYECLTLMLKNECDHLPGNDYLERLRNGDLDLGVRQEAVDWIRKKGKSWMMQLVALACLSLAAKMEETEVPLCVDLQVCESKFVFESRTIQRMELHVLSTLKWRMQAITPFSFIDYFLAKLNKNSDQITKRLSIFRSTQLILSILKGIDFLEFKPSEIAAAVAISVVGETQIVDNKKALYELVHHLHKEKVVRCVELMNKLSSSSGTTPNGPSGSVPFSVPQSPIGVLEAACLSYRTDDSTLGSCANSSHYSPATKRRKPYRPFEVEL